MVSQLMPRQLQKAKVFAAEQRSLGVTETELKALMIAKGYGKSTVKVFAKPAAKPAAAPKALSPQMLRYVAYQEEVAALRREQCQ